MTVARVSQAVLEVLRQTPPVQARVSQAVVEVLRVNGTETPLVTTMPVQLVIGT